MSKNVRITNELKNPSEAGTHYRFLCMTGPDKGRVYYLIGKRIIIGRGENADILIVDAKISREHAELSFSDGGYTITDLGAQNGIIVNDTKVKQKKLADAEKIVIGQTVFKYNIIEVTNSEMVVSSGEGNQIVVAKDNGKSPKSKVSVKTNNNSFDKPVQKNAAGKKGPPKIIIIGALLVGAYLFLFNDSELPKSKTAKNSTGSNDFDNFSPITPKKVSPEDAESTRKMETLIHSGRREFSEGNYFRAIEDFRLALLLNPNNGHASFYLSKAKQSLDDDIKKNMEKGKQEHESKKLQAAIVSYCGVLQLIQNYPDDERYKNAQLQISAIESELGMEKGEVKCFETKSAESKN